MTRCLISFLVPTPPFLPTPILWKCSTGGPRGGPKESLRNALERNRPGDATPRMGAFHPPGPDRAKGAVRHITKNNISFIERKHAIPGGDHGKSTSPPAPPPPPPGLLPELPSTAQHCPEPRGESPGRSPPRPQKCAESLLGPTYFPGDAQGFSENSQKSQNRVFKILKPRFLGFLETEKPDSGISGKYSGVAGLRRGARCLLDFS